LTPAAERRIKEVAAPLTVVEVNSASSRRKGVGAGTEAIDDAIDNSVKEVA
jgi:hypothetical protein